MPFRWGEHLKLEIYGSSHGEKIGVRIEGLPKGEEVDTVELRRFLERRAPGRSTLASQRREQDEPVILCGVTDGLTDGSCFEAVIYNREARPSDYEKIKNTPRPGHADYTAFVKYGGKEDMRGGGRFSGRMTAPLCIAGGVCLQLLKRRGINIRAHVRGIYGICDEKMSAENMNDVLAGELPVLSREAGEKMRAAILAAKAGGDSVGGVVECMAVGVPAGLGGPLFEGLEGKLASLLFAIPAVKGVEFGAGFEAASMKGSENNDAFAVRDGKVITLTNNAGGILGGISSGMPIVFSAAFKPTPSIAVPQRTVELAAMKDTMIEISGRHDPCIVPRAVPVVEAAAALALLDVMEQKNEQT